MWWMIYNKFSIPHWLIYPYLIWWIPWMIDIDMINKQIKLREGK